MSAPVLSVVIIGRNEGKRLVRCIEAVRRAELPAGEIEMIYVDSGSEDGSLERVAGLGLKTLEAGSDSPSPGLGRDIGWRDSSAEMILFLDGDSALEPGFVARAWHLFEDPKIAIVSGHVREYDPLGSIYNRALSLEWNSPEGPLEHCGGNCIVRRSALEAAGGFLRDAPGGEDAELCRQVRKRGWIVWFWPEVMVRHDMAMRNFRQYAQRGFRRGYSVAAIAGPDIEWRIQSRRSMRVWGGLVWVLLASAPFAVDEFGLWGAGGVIAAFGLLFAGAYWKFRERSNDPISLALYCVHWFVVRALGLVGQAVFYCDKLWGRKRSFISYKMIET